MSTGGIHRDYFLDNISPHHQFTAFVTNQFGGFKVVGTQFDELCEPATLAPFAASGRRVRIRRR